MTQNLFPVTTLMINKDKNEEGDGHATTMKTQRSPQSCTDCIFISTGAAKHPTVEEAQPENSRPVVLKIKPVK